MNCEPFYHSCETLINASIVGGAIALIDTQITYIVK